MILWTQFVKRGASDPPAVEHRCQLAPDPNPPGLAPGDKAENPGRMGHRPETPPGPDCTGADPPGPWPDQPRNSQQLADISRGGYVLRDASNGKGSTRSSWPPARKSALAVSAAEALEADGLGIRVISMPNPDLFESQDAELPRIGSSKKPSRARVAIRSRRFRCTGANLVRRPWPGHRNGRCGLGASAQQRDLFREFGFTV